MERAVMMGVASINWPIIIAVGVNRRPSTPKGPCLETSENTKRPTTTVGNAIRVLNNVITIFLPLNSLAPMRNPSGIPIREDNTIAMDDTLRDTQVQFITS
jgi:hypothetical protein